MPKEIRIPSIDEWNKLKTNKNIDEHLTIALYKVYETAIFSDRIDALFHLLDLCEKIERRAQDKNSFKFIKALNLKDNIKLLLMQLLDTKKVEDLNLLKMESEYFRNQDASFVPIIKPKLGFSPVIGANKRKHIKQRFITAYRAIKSSSKVGEHYTGKKELQKLSKEELINHIKNELDPTFTIDKYDKLDDSEKTKLLETASKGWDERHGVRYLNDEQRERYRIIINDGKLYYLDTINGFSIKPFNTTRSLEESIFVMNTKGDFFIHPKAEVGVIHHSSLLAGAPTMFAGQIQVVNGKILKIDNMSGHYKPNEQNILLGINYLRSRGVLSPDTELNFALKENNFQGKAFRLERSALKPLLKSHAIDPFFEMYLLLKELGSFNKHIYQHNISLEQSTNTVLNNSINKLINLHEEVAIFLRNLESKQEKRTPVEIFDQYQLFLEKTLETLKDIKNSYQAKLGYLERFFNFITGKKTLCDVVEQDIKEAQSRLTKIHRDNKP